MAVSGGADSTVLLHLLLRAVKQGALPLELAVAHCHFHLRGEEADGDQAFVENLAKEAALPFYTVGFDTELYAKDQAISIEMAARELRYNFFKRCMARDGWQACALAHHLDDQAETLYLNLLRGTGLKGLRGMWPEQGGLVRPLLFARRREIEAYAAEQGISYRTDSTNKEDDYLRNRVRHYLLPLCEALNPQAVGHAAQTTASLQRCEAVLEAWYAKAEARLVERRTEEVKDGAEGCFTGTHGGNDFAGFSAGSGFDGGYGPCIEEPTRIEVEFIDKAKLKQFRNEEGISACLCFWEWYLKERNFNQEQIEQIIRNYTDGEGGKSFDDRFGRRSLQRTAQGWEYRWE